MTFVPITDAEINQDSPVTQILMTKYRDNIEFVRLATTTVVISTPVASVEFTGFNPTLYNSYEIELISVVLVTDGSNLSLRTSSDGGATYDSGASDYEAGGVTGSSVPLTTAMGSSAGEDGASGSIRILGPDLPKKTIMNSQIGFFNTSGGLSARTFSSVRLSSADVDAGQILTSSGNIESGTIIFRGFN